MRRQRKCKRNDARAQQFNNIHALDTLLIVSVHWYDQNLLRLCLRNNLQLQTIQLVFQGSQAAAQQIVYDSAILLCMKKTDNYDMWCDVRDVKELQQCREHKLMTRRMELISWRCSTMFAFVKRFKKTTLLPPSSCGWLYGSSIMSKCEWSRTEKWEMRNHSLQWFDAERS